MASRAQILHTRVITKVVRRVAGSTSVFLNRFGMQSGGRNVGTSRQRKFAYDIFNDTRTVGTFRAPGVQSATVRRQPVGHVSVTIPRMAERLPLLYEELHNQRQIGSSDTDIDAAGRGYLLRQERFMGQRAANFRLATIGGMLRGNLYLHEDGDELYANYTAASATFTINYQIPAGNLNQLNMLGDGNIVAAGWQDPETDIPAQLMKINAAFQELTGSRLEVMAINSNTWQYLVNNDYVVSQAGVSNPPFRLYVRGQEVQPNGLNDTTFEAVLSAVPWLRIVISDEVIALGPKGSEANTKFLPDDYAWFGPEPGTQGGLDLMEMVEGPEPISEGPNMAPQTRNGLHAYSVQKYDPASIDLHTVDNALPCLYVPAATAWGHVANF